MNTALSPRFRASLTAHIPADGQATKPRTDRRKTKKPQGKPSLRLYDRARQA